ncbi:MAG: TetR family transcriptional regulator [Ilumatobacteraceae bacterium]
MGPRRLEPEQRRTQLLETAKGIIEREGIGACTIDLVSTEAGVTAQLVHKYFGTRSSPLQPLNAREEAAY